MAGSVTALYESNLGSLPLVSKGKVRDIYAVGDRQLLIVTSDRISAFDVILPDPIPGKGAVLTTLSNFWFERTTERLKNHLAQVELADVLPDEEERRQVEGRAIVVDKLQPLPIESIVRGYIIGSGWKDYQRTREICGIELPAGLEQAAQLPEPLFTPSTKAEIGDHDENIDFEKTCDLLGRERAEEVREISVEIYRSAADLAIQKGIIIADTKFEFGLDDGGNLVLIDEVLTPDSSRFWPVDEYRTGGSPPSFDKQFVRDYLETLDWDKRAPAPSLPQDIVDKTASKYREALERLTA
ncbi:MAG: phosphoribosylaminoimidazolesuccinocarboxamide synthase [Gammaproteobacteria bacterium]|nr:phosphoribosylaminoimidazolesuccinocarboxamide synthase [Gammaproteobacteria bacterium]